MSAEDRQVMSQGAPVSTLSGGTMHLTLTLNCRDEFGRTCTSEFPAPQCAPVVYDGQPCYPATGWICYKTESPFQFSEYVCY